MLTVESLIRILKKPMGIIKIDGEKLSFLEVNEPFCALSGYTREELMGIDPSLMLAQGQQPDLSLFSFDDDAFLRTEITALSKGHNEVYLEVELYRIHDGSNDLIIVFADHTSSKKWIDHQVENKPILCSGIVNASYMMTRYEKYFDPIVDHKSGLDHESIFELIAKEDRPVLKQILEEIKYTKQTKEIVLKTSQVKDLMELKMKITVRPFFDGTGTFLEYAFVISQLELFELSEDASIRLKVLMAQRSMSAQSLSEATGITIQTISKLRNGKVMKPQLLTAQLIAGELGVAVSDIWSETRR